MKTGATSILLLAVAAYSWAGEITSNSTPEEIQTAVSNSLDRIVFRHVSLTNVTMVEFAESVVHASVTNDPDGRGVSLIVNSVPSDDVPATARTWKVFSISAVDVTYRELLNRACALADCEWTQPGIPIVRPKKQSKDVEQRGGEVREPRGGSRAPHR